MNINKNNILQNAMWVMVSVIATFIFIEIIAGFRLSNNTIDIHFHDTYYVINIWHAFLFLLFPITFIVFYSKEMVQYSNQIFPKLIIIVSGIITIGIISLLIKFGSTVSGWTLHPPLSSLGNGKEISVYYPLPYTDIFIFIALQVLIIIMLMLLCFKAGKMQKNK